MPVPVTSYTSLLDTRSTRNLYAAKSRALALFLCCAAVFVQLCDAAIAHDPLRLTRYLYAVGEHGSIAVYDIDHGHRLVRTIRTAPGIDDVRGVAASGITGRLYVAYTTTAHIGMVYCLNIHDGRVLWNKAIPPGVDRLAIDPDGRRLFVPTGEDGRFDYINVVDPASGDVLRQVKFSSRSHDALYPLSGPLFQETKAVDGSGRYLYLIDPVSYSVSRIGPFVGVVGPYAADGRSEYVVADVRGIWGMQVADVKSKRIVTAILTEHPAAEAGLPHGIGWTPDEKEVWEVSGGVPHSRWESTQGSQLHSISGSSGAQMHREPALRPHYFVYVWDMSDPMAPRLKERLRLRRGLAPHWLNFDIAGDYAYVSGNKNSNQPTEVFDARTHDAVGTIRPSEDLLEVDFVGGKIIAVGDQYGIGRVREGRGAGLSQ